MGQRHGSRRSLAVVTGASSGTGAATARRLACEGYHVIATARRHPRLDRLVADITADGGAGTAIETDITIDADVTLLAETVAELAAPLAVLVNSAGGAFGVEPVEQAGLGRLVVRPLAQASSHKVHRT
ncbi:MAG: SDR family NAD(P)-dependent oxidoreductase [Dactylosporangium sp.]|nr:SDR family NAD(P)-dependent oxidoreductase [Dactylosporangium sp.]NNJ61729.1 SDR family NAD(P)-dependent oxidoreductase [Dactylosporangium sp.]